MTTLQLVLITGMSGSGKSVALAALEDGGFYCVDNLPPELLPAFIELQHTSQSDRKVAVAIDARSATALPSLPAMLSQLRTSAINMKSVFLDATDDALVRRFSETRRGHPLSRQSGPDQQHALLDAIQTEREMLATLREQAHVIDTSLMRPAHLLSYIRDLIQDDDRKLALVFESFAFKRGIPMDADFVFDVRMLPNPHYEPALKALTGKDKAVVEFLEKQAEVLAMADQISNFLIHWLPHLLNDHRNYVTVAIGCTGGQHRSVYLVEWLTRFFTLDWQARSRHRELIV